MLEGKPRESLVLYDTPIEVGNRYSPVINYASFVFSGYRLPLEWTLTILSRRPTDVSMLFSHQQYW